MFKYIDLSIDKIINTIEYYTAFIKLSDGLFFFLKSDDSPYFFRKDPSSVLFDFLSRLFFLLHFFRCQLACDRLRSLAVTCLLRRCDACDRLPIFLEHQGPIMNRGRLATSLVASRSDRFFLIIIDTNMHDDR